MPSQKDSFTFNPKTTQALSPVAVVIGMSMGACIYWWYGFQHGMGLTQESNRALPYLKRGRGNLRDKRIYFSTGLFASGAGRKRLLEFRPPAALLGRQREGPRRPGPCQGCPLGELPRPSLQHSLVGTGKLACWFGSHTLAERPSLCAGKGHHPVPWEWAGFFGHRNFQGWI